MLVRLATLAVLLSASASCVTYYQEPDANQSSARISFEKGYDRQRFFMNEVGQDFAVVQDRECSNASRIAFFTGNTGDVEIKRVAANKQLLFYADTDRGNVGMIGTRRVGVVSRSRCGFLASFTPETGREYSATLRMSDFSACSLEVLDKATGKKPNDLQVTEEFTCKVKLPYRSY